MILCCGEALIDMIPVVSQAGDDAYQPHSGGAVFNTALALGRLGAQVGIFTGLSTDFFGDQLIADLHASQVRTDLAPRVDRPTPLAFVRLQNGQAQYRFFDENSAVRMLGRADLPVIGADIDALYFSGISLCMAPVADAMCDLCLQSAPEKPIILDPNIRPSFAQDLGQYRQRLERMMRQADIIKVSDEDLDWLIEGDEADQVAQVLSYGAALVIVTRGGAGATAYTQSGAPISIRPPQVEVVDTVGAGDTFNAGMISGLADAGMLSKSALRQLSSEVLHSALDRAVQVAALNVARQGVNPPWRDEVPGVLPG